jgi:hypothetical protein
VNTPKKNPILTAAVAFTLLGASALAAPANTNKPVKVFILAGQ